MQNGTGGLLPALDPACRDDSRGGACDCRAALLLCACNGEYRADTGGSHDARYQTAHGTTPTKLSDLEPYVTNAEKLKPPSGNVILDGKESSLTNPTYEITTNDKKVCRATCDGKTAEAFRPKE